MTKLNDYQLKAGITFAQRMLLPPIKNRRSARLKGVDTEPLPLVQAAMAYLAYL